MFQLKISPHFPFAQFFQNFHHFPSFLPFKTYKRRRKDGLGGGLPTISEVIVYKMSVNRVDGPLDISLGPALRKLEDSQCRNISHLFSPLPFLLSSSLSAALKFNRNLIRGRVCLAATSRGFRHFHSDYEFLNVQTSLLLEEVATALCPRA